MEMTNKELIEKLKAYYMTQDRENVAYALSAVIIDIQRFWNFEKLGTNERKSLIERTQKNLLELQAFAESQTHTDLVCIRVDSDEEV